VTTTGEFFFLPVLQVIAICPLQFFNGFDIFGELVFGFQLFYFFSSFASLASHSDVFIICLRLKI